MDRSVLSRPVSAAVVAVLVGFALVVGGGTAAPATAAPAVTPPLVGDWLFNRAAGSYETTGNWSQFSLRGTGSVDNGELVVSGTGNGYNAASAWAAASGYTGPTITDKTLVSYVKVTDLTVRSGSPLSLYKPSGEAFDAIDWAERQPNRWMAGSDFFRRTQDFSPGAVDTAGPDVVRQIAISYDSTGTPTITGCLNGASLGSYNPTNTQSFAASDNPQVLFGARLIQQGKPYGSMNARILESRIYAGAMSCSQIAALPSPVTPTISTTPSAGTVAGGAISDSATVSGGSAPSGTVTFGLYGPDDQSCTGSPSVTRTVSLNSGSAGSGDVTVTSPGTYHWTATYSGDSVNSSVHTTCGDDTVVTAAALDHLAVSPASSTVSAGASQSYTAEGFDAYGNDLGDVTADTAFDIDGGGSCAGASCTPSTTAGSYTVTGTDGAATGTASLAVTAIGLDHLVVSPASVSVGAGGSQSYTAEGFDAYGNDLGDVTGDTTFDVNGGGSCAGASCTPSTTAGSYTVTATDGAATGTASLTVTVAALDHLTVSPSSASAPAGSPQTYSAEGFDSYGNSLGDVTGDTSFAVTGGSCSGAVCTPATKVGSYTVTATDGAVQTTAVLKVVVGPLARISLGPSAVTVTAGGSATFAVGAYDAYGNSRGRVTGGATLTIAGGGTCSGAVCTPPTKANSYAVTAAYQGFQASGLVRVVAGPLSRISLGLTQTVTAGSTARFEVGSYDAYGNPRARVTGDATVSIDGGGSCPNAVCTPSTKAGLYTVTASYRGLQTTTKLKVVAASATTRIVVGPSVATVVAGGSATFVVAAYDRYGNRRDRVTGDAVFTADTGASCSGSTCTSTTPGRYTVTASYQGVTGTAVLQVRPTGNASRADRD